MKKLIVIILAIATVCVSCKKERDTYSDYISSVKVVPTDNALRFKVEMVKAKECSPKVQVRIKGAEKWQTMPGEMALLLYPETEYECRVVVGELAGEPVLFSTGALPEEVPVYELTVDKGGPTDGYVLQWKESAPGYMTLCTMDGKVVWYESFDGGIRCAEYNKDSGRIVALTGTVQIAPDVLTPRPATDVVVLDLEGNRYASIKMSVENAQYPHHEMAGYGIDKMILNNHSHRTLDLSSVGGGADSEVWGDEIVLIDMNGQVAWRWDVLDHLDVVAASGYLPMNKLFDIVHMNSVAVDSEGNFYVSLLWIKEIWKIDGKTGDVLYRFGPHGDITMTAGYPVGGYHSIVIEEPDTFLVNNNSETMTDPTYGLRIKVNAASKTAECTLKVPLDTEYTSTTGGYFQILPDGKTYMFDTTQGKGCVFVDGDGSILRVLKRKDTSYRAFYFDHLF